MFSPQLSDLVYADELFAAPHTGPARSLDDQVAAAVAAHPEAPLDSLVVPADPDRTTGVVLDVDGLARTCSAPSTSTPTPRRSAAPSTPGSTPRRCRPPSTACTATCCSASPAASTPSSPRAGCRCWSSAAWPCGSASVRGPPEGADAAAAAARRPRPGGGGSWAGTAATGVWLTVALLFISATGLTWSTYAGDRFATVVDAVKQSTPALAAEPVPVRDGAADHRPGRAGPRRAAGLQGPLKVTVPAEPGAPFTVAEIARDWPVQRDEVALDPYTGAVTETILWQDFPVLAKLTRIGILAHMGDLFGLFNQLALAATALGLLCMIFWGYRMWWQRRPTRGGALRLTAPVRAAPCAPCPSR